MREPRVDVIVAGGGPAGAAAAIALRARGRSVVIIAHARSAPAIGETLPPDAAPLLRELDIWDALHSGAHQPAVCNQSAWGSAERHTEPFVASPHGHGWHLDRERFDAMLLDAATDAGAILLRGQVRHVASDDAGWRVDVELVGGGVRELEAQWLVDASGRAGAIASRLGIARVSRDQLTAAALMFHRRGHAAPDPDRATLVETARSGWWYTAALPGDRRIAIAFTTPAGAPRTVDQLIGAMADTQHVHARLEGYESAGSPWLFSAGTSRLTRPTGRRWLAVGDAAVAYDPVSSYGLMSAMSTGLRAASAIDAALDGRMSGITAYEMQLASDFSRYERTLDEVYALERRWPESEFWIIRSAMLRSGRAATPSAPAAGR